MHVCQLAEAKVKKKLKGSSKIEWFKITHFQLLCSINLEWIATTHHQSVHSNVILKHSILLLPFNFFYAQEHICYSAYMLSPDRPSVQWVDHRKRLKLGLWNFHHR